jgi:hypothetical protein
MTVENISRITVIGAGLKRALNKAGLEENPAGDSINTKKRVR